MCMQSRAVEMHLAESGHMHDSRTVECVCACDGVYRGYLAPGWFQRISCTAGPGQNHQRLCAFLASMRELVAI
eukprot:2367828-Pleurochrysis_carterae.AAC.2